MKKIYLLICFVLLSLAYVEAAGYKSVVIQKKGNIEMAVTIESGMVTSFADGNMKLASSKGDIILPINEVNHWTFSTELGDDNHWSGIENLESDGFSMQQNYDRISMNNLPSGSIIALYGIDGKVVFKTIASGSYELFFNTIPTGIYVLTVNNQSIKIAVK